jgi:hypothetical protein
MKTCLTHFLRFHHSVGIEFLYFTGLLKVGNSKNPQSTVVIHPEWDVSVLSSNLPYCQSHRLKHYIGNEEKETRRRLYAVAEFLHKK